MTEKFNAANTSFLFGLSHRRKVFLVNLYMLSTTLLDPNILSRVDENSSEYNGKKLAEKVGDEENLFRLLRTEEGGDKHLLSMKQVLLDEYGGSIENLKKAFESTDNSDKDDIENYFSEIKEKAPKKEVEKEYYGINKTSKLSPGDEEWKPEFIVVNPERPYIKGYGDEPGYRGKDIITGETIEAHYGQVKYIGKKDVDEAIELLKEAKKKKDDEAAEAAAVEGATVEGAAAVSGAEQQKIQIEDQRLTEENNNREALKKNIQDEKEAAQNLEKSLKAKETKHRKNLEGRLTRKKKRKEAQESFNKFERKRETREQAKILKSSPSSNSKGNRRTNKNRENTLTSRDDNTLKKNENQNNNKKRRNSVGGSRKK